MKKKLKIRKNKIFFTIFTMLILFLRVSYIIYVKISLHVTVPLNSYQYWCQILIRLFVSSISETPPTFVDMGGRWLRLNTRRDTIECPMTAWGTYVILFSDISWLKIPCYVLLRPWTTQFYCKKLFYLENICPTCVPLSFCSHLV